MANTAKHRLWVAPALFLACAVGVTGCSGGGGGIQSPSLAPTPAPPPPAVAPTIQVLPASFDFGRITTSNMSAPLQVTISNTGTVPLAISAISLAGPSGGPYALTVGSGSKPCASATPTIAAADSCTIQVLFQPSVPGTFNSTLQVSSNASNVPTVSLPISGTSEPVTGISVRVNQLDNACPGNNGAAFVSVTDQGGFTVLGLLAANFMISQGASSLMPTSATYVDQVIKPIAIAAVMDHSGSLTRQTIAFADMKTGFSSLVGSIKAGDVMEIVKFASDYEVTQPFTSDKAALQSAIAAPFSKGTNTLLYDSVYRAVDDTALQANFRRAVIVATDGIDEGSTAGVPLSTHTLQQVIDNAVAKNVGIFAIGIGSSVNAAVLNQMASQTGGIYYQADASQNLATIYQQLSTLLFTRQYVLTFAVTGPPSSTGPVKIAATLPSSSIGNDDTKSITVCGP
ncbi:MAG TPA: VWA domain-containing protein [Burkholderiaceae bacterium]|nr:VWA domain-containing protein [Burkholderiaceae bacterium]